MHLKIPQTQIGSATTLGILGTKRVSSPFDGRVTTDVQFLLRQSMVSFDDFDDDTLASELEFVLGVFPTRCVTVGSEACVIYLFQLVVDDDLRNPRGYLKSIARKISVAVNKILAQRAADTGDTEEWCKLMGTKKSSLNQWP